MENKTYSLNEFISITYTNNGGTILNLETNTYFGFNETGANILRIIEKKHDDIEAIIKFIYMEYNISKEEAEIHVTDFIDTLEKKKIVRIVK
jgi:spore coat protein CotH